MQKMIYNYKLWVIFILFSLYIHNGHSLSYVPHMTQELLQMRKQLMYPYSKENLLEITQGRPIHDQPLAFRLPFFGFEYNYIYIQRDGHFAFNKGSTSYKYPLKFPIQTVDSSNIEDPSLIAIWFAQQDIPHELPDAGIYLQLVALETESNITLKDRLILDFSEGMIGASDFIPKFAIIATWKNLTFANRQPNFLLKTNTYQAIIATDEMRTYAMFNYEQIEWIASKDNFDGTKGVPAFIGFNAGNTTRSFEFSPYSQQSRIKILTERGFGNGLKGRYFFQIDEEIWPGVCIDKDLDPNLKDRLPLTFFPRYGNMLGGVMVDVTGPCFLPDDIIICHFENRETKGIYRDINHASCISPPVYYHGYIDLSITVRGKTIFLGRYYVQPPGIVEEDIVVNREISIDSNGKSVILDDSPMYKENPEKLVITWKGEKLSKAQNAFVQVSLYGYKEVSDVYPSLTYIDLLESNIKLGENRLVISTERFNDIYDPKLSGIFFGFIAINLTNPSILGKNQTESPTLWSSPMPLAWYFKNQWEREYGSNGKWKDYLCNEWYDREQYGDRFATAVFRCPCTREQALIDRGRFSPDLECNIQDQKCFTFHRGAKHCVRTGRPSIGGSGQTCCYDEETELIQTADTMYGGRPSRAFVYGKHPFKMRMMIPVLSNYLYDQMPFFFCCKWQKDADDSKSCQKFNAYRTSQDCSFYQPPRIGSVFGDPHILTFDNHTYTFNGKGEYSLVHVDHLTYKLDVQARFEQVPRKFRTDLPINATFLTAIAAKDNQSATVEFRLRPAAARWRYQIYCIVDREYVFFWDTSLRVQNFRGVTIYQPADIRNMSHIVAMFDSGAGVEVMTVGGHMTVHVYLPQTFMNKTGGLLGYFSGNKNDDFLRSDGKTTRLNSDMREIHNFGMSWRVVEGQEKRGVGRSLFWHNAYSYAAYNDVNFEPQLMLPPQLALPIEKMYLEHDMISVCDESIPCRYDFLMTLDKEYAVTTKMQESWANEMLHLSFQEIRRCPALQKPKNGRKSENKYWPGTTVRFTCDEGYRLIGHEYRWCRADGLWSWGYDAYCVSTTTMALTLGGTAIGIILPIILILLCCILCLIRSRKHHHYTREEGMQPAFKEFTPYNAGIINQRTVASTPTTAKEGHI